MRLGQYMLVGILSGLAGGSLAWASFSNASKALLVGYFIFVLWWVAGNLAQEIRWRNGLSK